MLHKLIYRLHPWYYSKSRYNTYHFSNMSINTAIYFTLHFPPNDKKTLSSNLRTTLFLVFHLMGWPIIFQIHNIKRKWFLPIRFSHSWFVTMKSFFTIDSLRIYYALVSWDTDRFEKSVFNLNLRTMLYIIFY